MKCKVRLTRTVELIVEGENEDVILDWLRETTPEGAYLAANGGADDEYDEEIVYVVNDNSVENYKISQ